MDYAVQLLLELLCQKTNFTCSPSPLSKCLFTDYSKNSDTLLQIFKWFFFLLNFNYINPPRKYFCKQIGNITLPPPPNWLSLINQKWQTCDILLSYLKKAKLFFKDLLFFEKSYHSSSSSSHPLLSSQINFFFDLFY